MDSTVFRCIKFKYTCWKSDGCSLVLVTSRGRYWVMYSAPSLWRSAVWMLLYINVHTLLKIEPVLNKTEKTINMF